MYGVVPPLGVTVAVPSHIPLQDVAVLSLVSASIDGSSMFTMAESKQPFVSVTVTLYVPTLNPIAMESV